MLLPYSTDAPLYHWPAATLTLVVLNVLAFVISTVSVYQELSRDEAGEAEQFQLDPEDIEKLKQLFPDEDQPAAPADDPDEMIEQGDPVDDGLARAGFPQGVGSLPLLIADANLGMTPEEYEKQLPTIYRNFGVVYGRGLKPWQWFTALFLHGDLSHLIGNMMFLWSFGLVVEGKVGWWRFLLMFFGIGGAVNFLQQVLSFWFTLGVSFGASGAIFGLMAMCLVWAPMNEMNVLFWIAYRVFLFEMLIWKLALLYIVVNTTIVFLTGGQVSSELLHTMGLVIGFPLGVGFVKLNWVDCEGWDMFHVLNNTHGADLISRHRPDASKMNWTEGEPREEKREAVSGGRKTGPNRQLVRNKLKRLLSAGDAAGATDEFQKFRKLRGVLEEEELLKLIDLQMQAKLSAEAIPALESYLELYETQAPSIRLKLARILLGEERPRAAAKVLKAMNSTDLPQALAERRQSYLRKAKELIEQGVVDGS